MLNLSDSLTSMVWTKFRRESHCNNGRLNDLAMDVDVDAFGHPERASRVATMVTEPRRIFFTSAGTYSSKGLGTAAACSLTTTYVEVNLTCDGSACAPTGMRKSKLPHITEAATWFDRLSADNKSVGISLDFAYCLCQNFINSTGFVYGGYPSALTRYLANPDKSISHVGNLEQQFDEPTVPNLDNTVFSYRFAQLLNTYYLASTSLYSVTGNLTGVPLNHVQYSEGHGFAVNTTAQLQTTEIVLAYNAAWLIVLITGSLVMLAAGIATTLLNFIRRGPDILDSFTGMLRDNPHIHADTGPSTEGALEKARRLRKTKVMLGDVLPEGTTGHVALSNVMQTDRNSVQRLRSDRFYW